jgi:MtaA/CmuA family methyltransferase
MNGRERVTNVVRDLPADRLACMPITMIFASDFVGARYVDYETDHRVLAAAQLEVAHHFDLDHVSVISGPGVESGDCGGEVVFADDGPPALDERRSLLRHKASLLSLQAVGPRQGARMGNRLQAVRDLVAGAGRDRLVEGWVEGPCGAASEFRGLNRLMLDFYDDPSFVRDLLDWVVDLEIAFALAQVEAGADIIGIGDPAASLIGPRLYREFIWPGEQRMVMAVHAARAMCRLHICGNNRPLLAMAAQLGCEIVDVDAKVAMLDARHAAGPGQVLCGNLDPVRVIHDQNPEGIRDALVRCRDAAGPRYIVGGGCEIPRGTPFPNLEAMVGFARSSGPS